MSKRRSAHGTGIQNRSDLQLYYYVQCLFYTTVRPLASCSLLATTVHWQLAFWMTKSTSERILNNILFPYFCFLLDLKDHAACDLASFHVFVYAVNNHNQQESYAATTAIRTLWVRPASSADNAPSPCPPQQSGAIQLHPGGFRRTNPEYGCSTKKNRN